MTVNHEAVAALPASGAASKTLLRAMAVERFPYCLSDNEDSRDLVAVDPATGDIIKDILFLGRVFHFDAADSTTAHDGTTCLVSSEGKRYKLSTGTDVLAWAVLDGTRTAPPASPTIGDAHRVAAAATGAWSGQDDEIAVYTARGWEFVVYGIGRLLYDEATDIYWHRETGGAWSSGFGTQAVGDDSVKPSALVNAGVGYILKIENATTNTPPGSPSDGDAYVIGSSPTGVWSGRTLDVALWIKVSWDIYDPVAGDQVYDKSTSNILQFTGTQWQSAGGACVSFTSVSSTGNSGLTNSSGSTYNWLSNPTTPPSASSNSRAIESLSITHAAKKIGNLLRLTYTMDGYGDWNLAPTFALMRGSEATPLEYRPVIDYGASGNFTVQFLIAATDTSSHTYKIMIFGTSTTIGGLNALTYVYNRRLTLEEFVQ